MTEKKSALAGLCEAAWLLALVLTPVLFDARSTQPFEALKEGTVRIAALLVVLAIAIALPLRRGALAHARPHLRGGVAAVVGLVLLSCATDALSTAASLDPLTSLVGTWTRKDGLLHLLACVALGASVVGFLRTPPALGRIVTAVQLAASLVALYALLQYHGADPFQLIWTGNIGSRPASTVGNPIQMSAYLLLTVPLSFRQIVVAEQEASRARIVLVVAVAVVVGAAWLVSLPAGAVVTTAGVGALWVTFRQSALPRTRSMPTLGRSLTAASSVCVVALSGAALLAAQSRGPAIGLAAGLGVALAAWCAALGRRRWAVGASFLAALLALLVVAANISGSPLERAKVLPFIGRVLDIDIQGKTLQSRVQFWRGALDAASAHPARTLVGSGPATFMLAFNSVLPPELAAIEQNGVLPDRAHNEVIHRVVTTGLLGAATYVALQTAVIALALAAAGALGSRRRRGCAMAGAGGGALLALFGGARAGGAAGALVAAPLGAVVGLVVGLLVASFDKSATGPSENVADPLALALALVAALVGHVVELQAGFGSAEIDSLWWILVGVLLAWAMRPELRAASAGVATGRAAPALLALAAAAAIGLPLLEPPRHLPAAWLVGITLALVVLVALGHDAAPLGPLTGPAPPKVPETATSKSARKAPRARTTERGTGAPPSSSASVLATATTVTLGTIAWAAALSPLGNAGDGNARALLLVTGAAGIAVIVLAMMLATPSTVPLKALAWIGGVVAATAFVVVVPAHGLAPVRAHRLAHSGHSWIVAKRAERGLELLRAAAALTPPRSRHGVGSR